MRGLSSVAPAAPGLSIRYLEANAIAGGETALLELDAGTLHGLVVRGVYDRATAARIAATLEAGDERLSLQARDSSDSKAVQTRTGGIPTSPSDVYPRGPDVGTYHASAPTFRALCAELFAPAPELGERCADLFSRLAAGRPARLAQHQDGRPFGALTLRCVPNGCGFPPHCENDYAAIAVYDSLRERVRLLRKLGFFIRLQVPESGGELVLYDKTHVAGGRPFPDRPLEVVEQVPHVRIEASAGDLVVLPSGSRYHQVTRVHGSRARWTAGGFGAFTTDGDEFWHWA